MQTLQERLALALAEREDLAATPLDDAQPQRVREQLAKQYESAGLHGLAASYRSES